MAHTALLAPLFGWLSAPGVRRLFVDLSSIVRPEGLLNGERSISKRSSDGAQSKSDGWMRAFDFAKIRIFFGLRKGLGDIFFDFTLNFLIHHSK